MVSSAFMAVVLADTIPWFGRLLDSRLSSTSDSAYKVSPAKTGAVRLISVQPRLAIAFWLRSLTLMPATIDKVSAEFTNGLPNSVFAAYSTSKWIGCVFIVNSVNQVLSASVIVLPGRCS